MTHFFQEGPEIKNAYSEDEFLKSYPTKLLLKF